MTHLTVIRVTFGILLLILAINMVLSNGATEYTLNATKYPTVNPTNGPTNDDTSIMIKENYEWEISVFLIALIVLCLCIICCCIYFCFILFINENTEETEIEAKYDENGRNNNYKQDMAAKHDANDGNNDDDEVLSRHINRNNDNMTNKKMMDILDGVNTSITTYLKKFERDSINTSIAHSITSEGREAVIVKPSSHLSVKEEAFQTVIIKEIDVDDIEYIHKIIDDMEGKEQNKNIKYLLY